jgi:hypothetical protein
MDKNLFKQFKEFELKKRNHKQDILRELLQTPPKTKKALKEPMPKLNF